MEVGNVTSTPTTEATVDAEPDSALIAPQDAAGEPELPVAIEPAPRLDEPVLLHPLTYLDEGDEVTVGRADIDSYCVLPADGAAVLRQLEAGRTPEAAAAWYESTYNERVDIAEFLEAMTELGFVRGASEVVTAPEPVRWQRLGQVLYSAPALAAYALLIAVCAVLMVRHNDLAPHYKNIFFTHYLTVMELTLAIGQIPLILLHEASHALAGRRLGIRSSLSISRRLYYIVFETALDGLVTVPRRKRYLPMFAGMLTDLVIISTFTIVAQLTRRPDGSFTMLGGALVALAFTTLLRIVWQFFFYLETDIYQVVVTVLGCNNLQATSKKLLKNVVWSVLRRPEKRSDPETWYPRDRAVARWYAWFVVVGYAVSIGTLLVVGLPTMWAVIRRVFDRFVDGTASVVDITDAAVFLALNLGQLAFVGWLAWRGRHRRSTESSRVLD
jgi:hypothetical protein